MELFARFPSASLATGRLGKGWVLLFYSLLFGLALGLPQVRGRIRADLAAAWTAAAGRTCFLLPGGVMPIAALAVFVWRAGLAAPDGRMHLVVLEVNGGEALLLTTPSGGRVLIKGGLSPTRLSDALGRRLPRGSAGWTGWWWRTPPTTSSPPCLPP